ncbi:MAG: DUF429 domain-containing protein [Myxococcales bacterium]|nr:DUF429 domain-containing protein [Myxococcales bacterium]
MPDSLDLVGTRFSSVKPPNPTWIAWGTERNGALAVDGVDRVGATFFERIARAPPRVLAVDTALGVPAGLARTMVPLVTNGWQVLEHLVVTPGPVLDSRWAEWSAAHPGALRLTEALCHGAPSVTAARPPLWRHLRAFAKALWELRDQVAVLPFDSLEMSPLRPMVLESVPATTLRVLGLPFAFHHADPTQAAGVEATRERLEVLRRLPDALLPYGVRFDLPASVVNLVTLDTAGDALDAIVSLVTAYLATRGQWAPPPITGPHASRALIEGWIVRPA